MSIWICSQLGTDGDALWIVHLRASATLQRHAFSQPPVYCARHIVLGSIARQYTDRLLDGIVEMDSRPMTVGSLERVRRHLQIGHTAHVNAMHGGGSIWTGGHGFGDATQAAARLIDREFRAADGQRTVEIGRRLMLWLVDRMAMQFSVGRFV